jgi:hypothetical protein
MVSEDSFHIHNNPSLVLFLNEIESSMHTPTLFKINFNIILPSLIYPGLPSCPSRSGFPTNINLFIYNIPHAGYMSRPFIHPWSDHPNNIWLWTVQTQSICIWGEE